MSARLIHRSRFLYPDGALREMVLWQVLGSVHYPRALKYRLYYGDAIGNCLVRYDNERGKGDHRHFGSEESVYDFRNVESLVTDFLRDIKQFRSQQL